MIAELWTEDGSQILQPPQEMREIAASPGIGMAATLEARGHAELEARAATSYDHWVGSEGSASGGATTSIGSATWSSSTGRPCRRTARWRRWASCSSSSARTAGFDATTCSSRARRDDDGPGQRRHARGRALRRRGSAARAARGRHRPCSPGPTRSARRSHAAGAMSCGTTCATPAPRPPSIPRLRRTRCAISPPTPPRSPANSTTGRRTWRASASAGWSPRSPRSTTRTRSRRSPSPERGPSLPAGSTTTCPTTTRRR